MKRRSARKGFWWWSWLLILCLILGVVAGWRIGRQEWAGLPKEFIATAEIKVTPRPSLPSSSIKGSTAPPLTTGELDMRLLSGIRDQEALGRVVKRLQLAKRWKMSEADAIAELRTKVDATSAYEENQFFVKAIMHNPEDAALVANTLAEVGIERIQQMTGEDQYAGLEILDSAYRDAETAVEDARQKLKAALARNDVPLDPPADLPLSANPNAVFPSLELYYQLNGVAGAALEWDLRRRSLEELEIDQAKFRDYWQKPLEAPRIIETADPPAVASGPKPGPHVQKGVLFGMTIGLATGLLGMFLCWKVFK